jgi:photosystem II stability/assembly factor-like uncharacterized protein
MKYSLLLSFLLIQFCNNQEAPLTIEIETILSDTLLNVRALEIDKGTVYIATATSDLKVLRPNTDSFVELFEKDKLNKPNFRALAIANDNTFALGIGSPSLLYKNGEIVYIENHEKAFYDAMEFWNDEEGIAMGDPIENCISIIITRDSGNTWTKISCNNLPSSKEGEAAFAASDSNIAIKGDKTWIATGGNASRVLYSPDKGLSWEVFDTPIIQGTGTTGMYSIDFYNDKIGFAIGGDYTSPDKNVNNKIHTTDGGKTWTSIASGQNPGYRSCVQYFPEGKGKKLISLGFKGIDYSQDGGKSWTHLSDEGFYTIRFLNETTAYAAGKGRVSKITFDSH